MYFQPSLWKSIKLSPVTKFQLYLDKISTHECSAFQTIFPAATNIPSITSKKMITWRSNIDCLSATIVRILGNENASRLFKVWVSFSLIYGSIQKRSLTNAPTRTAAQLSVKWATFTSTSKLTPVSKNTIAITANDNSPKSSIYECILNLSSLKRIKKLI